MGILLQRVYLKHSFLIGFRRMVLVELGDSLFKAAVSPGRFNFCSFFVLDQLLMVQLIQFSEVICQ